MALVLAPEEPIGDWIVELDGWLERSPGFFAGRPVILDISGISLNKPDLANLLSDLNERRIRIMGIEGTDPTWLSLGMPPLVSNGRQAGVVEVIDLSTNDNAKESPEATSLLIGAVCGFSPGRCDSTRFCWFGCGSHRWWLDPHLRSTQR
jgi:septum site-determining protein MinC